MAVSGSFDWTLQRNDLIATSLKKIGQVAKGQTPTALQISDGAIALNAILKELPVKMSLPRKIVQSNASLAAASLSHSISTSGAIAVLSVFLRDSAGDDYPVDLMTRQEYNEITDKDYVARPTKVFVRYNLNNSVTLHFNYKTDEAYTIYIDEVIMPDDMDASTNDAPVPVECTRFLIYRLAADLADDAGHGDTRIYRLNNAANGMLKDLKAYFEAQSESDNPFCEGAY
jgi:hypothetical protein